MYYIFKNQLLCLVITVSVLLASTLSPPLLLGGEDLDGSNNSTGPDSALIIKNDSQRLIGTAVSGDPLNNFAIIERNKGREQWIYREGDIVGGLLIKKILSDRIIVDGGSGDQVVQLRRSLMTVAEGVQGPETRTIQATTGIGNGSRNRYYFVDSRELTAAFTDPKRLKETISMHPVKGFNRDQGIRLGSFAPESVFAAMGLRRGDLLLAIDGQEVVAPSDAVALLQTMLADGQAELKVKRRARTYRFHLQAE